VNLEQADSLNRSIRLISIKHRALATSVFAGLGLHPGQETILFALHEHGPLSQVQLAEQAGCEPPSITGMVRKLQAAGFVDRHQAPTDARSQIVELTAAGQTLIPRLEAAWVEIAERATAGLSPGQLTEIGHGLRLLADHLQNGPA
jgi:DNA-binding MarR family transcriptional regulator